MTFRFWFGKDKYVLRDGESGFDAAKLLSKRQQKLVTKVERVVPSSEYRDGGKW